MDQLEKTDRWQSLDWARGTACLLIIVIHVVSPYCVTTPFGKQYLFCLAIESVARTGLPVFFLLSGLLLVRPYANAYAILDFYKKRARKLMPLFLLWSCIYYFYISPPHQNPLKFLRALLADPVASHLWFVYSLFGIYLIAPFLANILIQAKRQSVFYFCAICMLCLTIKPFAEYLRINYDLTGLIPNFWLIYFISGYCLSQINQLPGNHILIPGYVLGTICVFALSMFTSNSVTPIYDFVDPKPYDANISMWVASLCFLALFHKNMSLKLPRIVKFFAGRSYGIYLSHVFYIALYDRMLKLEPWYLNIMACLVFVLCMCMLTEIVLVATHRFLYGFWQKRVLINKPYQ